MSSKRVLIVEDDENVRILLRIFLIRMNLNLMEARSGIEAFGLAKQIIPDLIITDLYMPGMDGIGLIKKIRSDGVLMRVPIIVVTGGTPEAQENAMNAGANAVIGKPLARRELVTMIESVLK